jgi:hypothetical protein
MYLHRPKTECWRSRLLSIGPSIWSVSQLGTMIGMHESCCPYVAGRSQSCCHENGPTCHCARGAASRNRLSSSASDDLSYNSTSDNNR